VKFCRKYFPLVQLWSQPLCRVSLYAERAREGLGVSSGFSEVMVVPTSFRVSSDFSEVMVRG